MSEPKDPRELLTLLTDKVQQFFTLGGDPFYTSDEVAYILSHVKNPNARLFARVKYAGQLIFSEELARSTRMEVLKTDNIRKWQAPRPDWILDMARLAIYEDVDPFRCPVCKGIETRLIEGKIINCEACKGTGGAYFTDADRARILKLDRSNWSRIWRFRYDFMRGETIWAWDKNIGEVIQHHRNAHHVYAT